jgi:hypothetical protein
MRHRDHSGHQGMGRHPYAMFAVNILLSLVVMCFVMFSMIDGWRDFRNNLNMLYMALTMVAPMGTIMLATMGGMYRNKRLNTLIHVGLVILLQIPLSRFGRSQREWDPIRRLARLCLER